MLTFAFFAILAFVMNLPFFAATLIILYVSAVTVLFVYVVLMLPSSNTKQHISPLFLFSILLFLCFLGLVSASYYCSFDAYTSFYYKNFFIENNFVVLNSFMLNQLEIIGIILYSKLA
jgi:NADH:ubiquinone oxidoreductase subunit 6 (subunit J)